MDYDITDIELASSGRKRIEWAGLEMRVLESIRKRFEATKPLKGTRIGACLHVTSETANLAITLKAGGAEVFLCASNPLSTQDDVAASLVRDFGISVFARKGEDGETYYQHIESVLSREPVVTMDDGADLITTFHRKYEERAKRVLVGTEETTTGVIRLKSMEKMGVLLYPVIAVNDAYSKHLFDNRYGTGQSTLDGIIRATNLLLAGRVLVVFGYGMCGKGISSRAKGMGSNVIVVEVDSLKALEAVMDGFEVMSSLEAARRGDIFITATGDKHVIRREHFDLMKDRAVVCNSGHFDVEIDIPALESMCESRIRIREHVEEFRLSDGRRVYLLGEGRLVNLAAAEGHPACVMDLSFSNQALSVEYALSNSNDLERKVYRVPADIDSEIARLKLETLGIEIDQLTPEQKDYLESWTLGT
ncbi:MAG: adenosylhomocysteinase [Actinomycetota bacterium]|nr:adenosylhomocysteinase [Actinomycetota bacterium]